MRNWPARACSVRPWSQLFHVMRPIASMECRWKQCALNCRSCASPNGHSWGEWLKYYLSQRRLAPRKNLEFDASEAILRMVSSGIGWAITTPLCLLQSHLQALDIEVLPLPPPLCFRRICVIYRPGELVQITQQIIELCRDCVETSILPKLKKLAPWPDVVSGDLQSDV